MIMLQIKYYWILYVYCTSAGIFSLYLFIHKQCQDAKEWSLGDLEENPSKEYDFIVVGGGSAGSIVAARLAKDRSSEVLLLEAGDTASSVYDIPLIAPMLQRTHCDWQYETVPQRNACLSLTGRISKWPMGKLLGGTSRLNYMIYLRGHPTDFEPWPGWSWSDSLYYFKRNEHHLGRYSENRDAHGDSGPIYVSDIPYSTELSDLLMKAGLAAGFRVNIDLNSEVPIQGSLMQTQVTGKHGSRWSADKILESASSNLHVMTNSVVEKVLLRKSFEAYGVVFWKRGKRRRAFARRAVILSAGVIGSPKILMQSGIGHPNHLKELNIKPKIALPVGDNLQDHITTGLDLIFLNVSLPLSWTGVLNSLPNSYQYIFHGTGLLTHSGTDVIGLFHTDGDRIPDIQLMALPAGVSSDAGVVLAPAMGISKKVWDNYFSHFTGQQVITILPVLLHPKSRGTVRLKSKNLEESPIIDPNYLSHPDDARTLIRGIRLIQKLVSEIPGSSFNKKVLPGCEWAQFDSDDYWECYVRHITLTSYHPCGTASIGKVVTTTLRVYNTSHLYIIDASVMPTLTSGNINSVVMMLAEKGADIIRKTVATSKSTCRIKHIFCPPIMTYLS